MGFRRAVADSVAAINGVPAASTSRPASPRSEVEAAHYAGPQYGIKSPWLQPTDPVLSKIIRTDVFGPVSHLPLNRDAAIGVPALARARHILAGTIAACQLQLFRRDELVVQPKWMRTTEAGLPAFHRMLWTVDDHLFYGWSLWEVERQGDNPDRPLVADSAPRRIAQHRWEFEADTGRVLVDGDPMKASRLLLLPGPHEGILTFARTAIAQAADLEAAATKAASTPSAYLNLHYDGDAPLARTEVDTLVADWHAARAGDNGGVAYTGPGVTVTELGSASEHLLIEGRNAAAVNMARVASMPAAMVDATTAGASLTYETTAGRNAELLDYGLNLYMDAITARLSMDDVVTPTQSVRFDTTQLRAAQPSPTGPTTED
jgi:hypothetical protein